MARDGPRATPPQPLPTSTTEQTPPSTILTTDPLTPHQDGTNSPGRQQCTRGQRPPNHAPTTIAMTAPPQHYSQRSSTPPAAPAHPSMRGKHAPARYKRRSTTPPDHPTTTTAIEGRIRGRPPQHAKEQAPRQPHTSTVEVPQHACRTHSRMAYPAAPSRPESPSPKRSHVPITTAHYPAKMPAQAPIDPQDPTINPSLDPDKKACSFSWPPTSDGKQRTGVWKDPKPTLARSNMVLYVLL
ncbi:hypothetical protein CRENBAI_022129 [Crenichthys baileyi]|uniref:Uncharacterized protein n=1 Tax=Crenichthys baileyi TaxID=28760 RepID=A0AAV9SAI2_9TELE